MNLLAWLDEKIAACDQRATQVDDELKFVYLDAARDNRAARAAVAELIEALDDDLNGDDPAEWCDDHASAKAERERVTKARRERLIAALTRVSGGQA